MKRLAIATTIILAVVAVAVLVWRVRARPGEPPLQAGWPAIAAVFAGDGTVGVRDGDRVHARFSDPFGVAAAPDGSVYVSDAGSAQRIRRIAPDGTVSSVAGGEDGFADGLGGAARFSTPSGIALGPDGALYVADTGNNKIRRVTPDGRVTTIAGILEPGYADGDVQHARFNGPVGVAVERSGRVIVADTYNDRIRAVEPGGFVVTVAGSGQPGDLDGPAADARFDTPSGVAVDGAGNIYVADTGNGVVRVISPGGAVSTLPSTTAARLSRPVGVAVLDDGIVYVTDDRGRIVEIDRATGERVLAGWRPGFADGEGQAARFRALTGVAVLEPGRLLVVDARNALVRLVAARARLPLTSPASPFIAPRFDAEAFAGQPLLWPIAPMEGPFEITGTMGEARGGEGTERFHAGVDVHAPEGSVVRAVRAGTIVSPAAASDFGGLNESVRVGPLAYVHVRVGRTRDGQVLDASKFAATYDEAGHLVRVRARRGASFAVGEPIGSANPFNHVHLNVGWPGEEYNPLRFRLVQFTDTLPPTIGRGGIRVFDEAGRQLRERRKGRLVVSGRVQIVVDAWDQVDGNVRRRRLGVYRLGYQILNRDGAPTPGFPAPRETIRFDRLAPDDEAARLVYAPGSGIPFYGSHSTHFFYVVTNSLHEGAASSGAWDTTSVAPGDYLLRVVAADIAGNEALANRDLPITVERGGAQ